MAHPMSVRFGDEQVVERLRSEAVARGTSSSALAEELIDEGLRSRRHPLVTFRDGPGGQRASLHAGPDVWEVVDAMVGGDVSVDDRIQRVSEMLGLSSQQVEAVLAYYAEFTGEIDTLIDANHRASDEAEELWRRKRDLLAR